MQRSKSDIERLCIQRIEGGGGLIQLGNYKEITTIELHKNSNSGARKINTNGNKRPAKQKTVFCLSGR